MWSLGGSASSEIADDLRLKIDADYRLISYDFSRLFVDPWDEVHVFTLTPTFRVSVTEVLSILLGPSVEFSGEGNADFGDSLTLGGLAGIGYQFSEDLHITLGIVASSEIEDDAYVQPLVLVNWEITDGLRFRVDAQSTRGGAASLGYTFLEDWTAGIGVGFRRERFRLDERPSIRRDGVGEEEATEISGSLAYAFTEKIALEGYLGSTLDGEFKLDDRRGNRIAKSDYDDAVYGGLRFRYGF
jgi:hypothetical protein